MFCNLYHFKKEKKCIDQQMIIERRLFLMLTALLYFYISIIPDQQFKMSKTFINGLIQIPVICRKVIHDILILEEHVPCI